MKCPKCPGHITETLTNKGAKYGWCQACKGIWISLHDLQMVMTDRVLTFLQAGLRSTSPTSLKCSYCDSLLVTCKVDDSELQVEECLECERYFFEAREIDLLLTSVGNAHLPRGRRLQFDEGKLRPVLGGKCPVCLDQPLYSYDNKGDRFKTCLKCDGILTPTKALDDVTKQSIFATGMFTLLKERPGIVQCRYCLAEQEPENKFCSKCGRSMMRVRCEPCKTNMGEFSFRDVTIERCQTCHSVWLDAGEFEQVMTVLPDLRKRYEEGLRRLQIEEASSIAVTASQGQGIDVSRRKILDRFWGRWSFFFYDTNSSPD